MPGTNVLFASFATLCGLNFLCEVTFFTYNMEKRLWNVLTGTSSSKSFTAPATIATHHKNSNQKGWQLQSPFPLLPAGFAAKAFLRTEVWGEAVCPVVLPALA